MSRDLAAWLARELAPVTLRELSAAFGLTHPDNVRNLIRRADRALLGSRKLRDEIEAIRHRLPKTGTDLTKPPDPAKPQKRQPRGAHPLYVSRLQRAHHIYNKTAPNVAEWIGTDSH